MNQSISFRPKRKRINRKTFLKEILNWIVLIFIAAILGYAIITFIGQTVTVVGPSMHGTLEDQQVVYVNKFEYRIHDVKRYDIIAYSSINSNEYYDIKRVIGLPGETIQIREGLVYINGKQLVDIPNIGTILNSGVASNEIVLGNDQYFVLGDNVNNSEDSRYNNIGNINRTQILGRVDSVISPNSQKHKVK